METTDITENISEDLKARVDSGLQVLTDFKFGKVVLNDLTLEAVRHVELYVSELNKGSDLKYSVGRDTAYVDANVCGSARCDISLSSLMPTGRPPKSATTLQAQR